MFKLYQVVNGKAHLCGYTNNKRSLITKAISLPTGLSQRKLNEAYKKPRACVAGMGYY